MEKAFFQSAKSNQRVKLNESQIEAVKHFKGPALVLAVPGAGKTTALITRTAYLIKVYSVNPKDILSITFSKSSAADMLKRFQSVYGSEIHPTPKFSTIHSFAYSVIKNYCREMRLHYDLIPETGQNSKAQLLKSIYKEVNGGFLSEDKLEELINAIGYIKNMMISESDYKTTGIKNFPDVYATYENYKKENDLIDFDDMLTLCFEILSQNKDVLEAYRKRYQYIQVDEGQDTSNIQHSIISILAFPLNNLFIVSDDDQSIYGFRGANPKYLLEFKEKYPDALIFHMNKNYRSTVDIVSIANKVIKKNKIRYNKNLVSASNERHPINALRLETQEDQYSFILKNMESFDDTAVLFRNNLSAIPLIDILDRKNIPFKIKDTKLQFFNHWLLRDIVCFLKLSIDQTDTSSFEKIYYKMKGYISKKAMTYAVKNLNLEISVFSALEKFSDLKTFQRDNMRKLSLDFAKLGKKRPLEAIEFIENNLEYLNYLKEKSNFLGYGLDSSLKLLSIIKSISSRCSSTLDFLDRLRELRLILSEKKDSSGLFISTLHSSKGLEFESVFIIDLVNGDFPSSSAIESMQKNILDPLEEERRLFYVGMTRAKKNLYLLSYNYKNDCRVVASMFLSEVESAVNEEKCSSLEVNLKVHHNKFGVGTILDMDSNSILIDFEKAGKKQLSKSICMESDLLKILNKKS